MVEVLIGVLLLGIGGASGWFLRMLLERGKQGERETGTPEAREAQRMQAERQAFETLMGYNVDMAYGLDGREE